MLSEVSAIILARGGSKGIKNKNLTLISGKPLLYWSVKAALKARSINKIYVSSDSDEILSYSSSIGAEVIKRPPEISSDLSSSEEGWIHAIERIKVDLGAIPEAVVALQATSPVRGVSDLDTAFSKFVNLNLDSLFSSEVVSDHYIWSKSENNFFPENFIYSERNSRQLLQKRYLENGSFYIFDSKKFLAEKKRHFGTIGTHEMSKLHSFQIDDYADLYLVETLLNKLKESETVIV